VRYVVRLESRVIRPSGGALPPEALELHLDDIAEALSRAGALDPDVGGVLTRGETHVGVVVDADSQAEAFERGASQIAEAIQSSGGHLPERIRFVVEPDDELEPLAFAVS